MLVNVTTADLCELSHDELTKTIKDPYVDEDEQSYTEEAKALFENIYRGHEIDLSDKGYTLNTDNKEWEPTHFFIGDPSLILGERYERLFDFLGHNPSSGRTYLRPECFSGENEFPFRTVPILWAYTVEGDGVFGVYTDDELISEVATSSGAIAFVPEGLVDVEHVFESVKEGYVMSPIPLSIENFLVRDDQMRVGDIRVSLKEDS